MRLSLGSIIPLALVLATLVFWLFLPGSSVDHPSRDIEQAFRETHLETRDGLRILHLKGTPYEMGYQHGVALRREIRQALRENIHEGLISGAPFSHFLLLRYARHVQGYLPTKYREEMRGLADSASIAYSDIVILNSFQDLISQSSSSRSAQHLLARLYPPFIPPWGGAHAVSSPAAIPEQASSASVVSLPLTGAFAAFGSSTEDGSLFQGLELAATDLSMEQVVLIVYEPRGSSSFVSFAWPGAVGVTMGLNEEKLSVAALPVPSRDTSVDGVPLPFILRDVLEYAGGTSQALRLLASAPRTIGHNVIIGDGKPADAKAIELSAHLYAVFEAEDDLVIRTNHYLDPTLWDTQDVRRPADDEGSQGRWNTLAEMLSEQYGGLDLAEAASLLSGPRKSAIEEEHGLGGGETLLGIVLAPSNLEIWIVSAVPPEGTVQKLGVALKDVL